MVEWVFIRGDGAERGTSEAFATQAEAEAWFATIYRMSLGAE